MKGDIFTNTKSDLKIPKKKGSVNLNVQYNNVLLEDKQIQLEDQNNSKELEIEKSSKEKEFLENQKQNYYEAQLYKKTEEELLADRQRVIEEINKLFSV